MSQPKYKKELRQEIINNANSIKNVYALRALFVLSDILKHGYDEKECNSLTKNEWSIMRTIMTILHHREEVTIVDGGNVIFVETDPKKHIHSKKEDAA